MLDEARYALAVALVAVLPPALLFWFSVHPFIGFWRRLGLRRTLLIHYLAIIFAACLIVHYRRSLVLGDLGTQPVLLILGAILLMLSLWLRRRISARFPWRTLLGFPEIEGDSRLATLITGGAHGVVRHPRYLQLLLASLGWALVANFWTGYVAVAACLLAVLIIIRWEDRELRDRFGAAWDKYAARTPALLPRFHRPSPTSY